MLRLYHAPGTRSVRVRWLLEELGLPYELAPMRLGDRAMRAPEYLAVNPNGRVPTLVDGDVTIHESGAIVEYVLARHGCGRLRPPVDSPTFPAYLQWLHYAEGMLMPPVNTIVVETLFLPEEKRNPVNVDRARRLLGRMLAAVDKALQGREFLAGEFSAADIMTGHACMAAAGNGADVSDKPDLVAYTDRLAARPALVRARAD